MTKHKDEPEHNPLAAVDPPQVEDTGNPTPLSPPEDIAADQHTEPKAKPKH
jgi:hypothetical protein